LEKIRLGIMASTSEIFCAPPEFCPICGSIFPVRTGGSSDNECQVCRTPVVRNAGSEDSDILERVSYVVHFNDRNVYSKLKNLSGDSKKGKPTADGPLVTRDCRQCGHNKMSYMTLQLRSADEGQTVFFTCPKCKFKESENS